jgi:hypothetical protein
MSVLAREWVAQSPGNYAEMSSPSETDISTKKLSIVRHSVVTDPVVFGSESHPKGRLLVVSIVFCLMIPNSFPISRSWRCPN